MTTLEDVKRATKIHFDPYAEARKLAREGVGITEICDRTGVHEDIAWAYIQLDWNDRLRHEVYRV